MKSVPAAAFACRLPLLITGATGVAGYNALHYFQRKYPGQVVGVAAAADLAADRAMACCRSTSRTAPAYATCSTGSASAPS